MKSKNAINLHKKENRRENEMASGSPSVHTSLSINLKEPWLIHTLQNQREADRDLMNNLTKESFKYGQGDTLFRHSSDHSSFVECNELLNECVHDQIGHDITPHSKSPIASIKLNIPSLKPSFHNSFRDEKRDYCHESNSRQKTNESSDTVIDFNASKNKSGCCDSNLSCDLRKPLQERLRAGERIHTLSCNENNDNDRGCEQPLSQQAIDVKQTNEENYFHVHDQDENVETAQSVEKQTENSYEEKLINLHTELKEIRALLETETINVPKTISIPTDLAVSPNSAATESPGTVESSFYDETTKFSDVPQQRREIYLAGLRRINFLDATINREQSVSMKEPFLGNSFSPNSSFGCDDDSVSLFNVRRSNAQVRLLCPRPPEKN